MNTSFGIRLHEAAEWFEGVAAVMRRLGASDDLAARVGHYAALRSAGINRDEARAIAGIATRLAGVPETPATDHETTLQTQGK